MVPALGHDPHEHQARADADRRSPARGRYRALPDAGKDVRQRHVEHRAAGDRHGGAGGVLVQPYPLHGERAGRHRHGHAQREAERVTGAVTTCHQHARAADFTGDLVQRHRQQGRQARGASRDETGRQHDAIDEVMEEVTHEVHASEGRGYAGRGDLHPARAEETLDRHQRQHAKSHPAHGFVLGQTGLQRMRQHMQQRVTEKQAHGQRLQPRQRTMQGQAR
ncbi:hypothetical protein KCV01_g8735, partial [Aureobasidium melanogenum]